MSTSVFLWVSVCVCVVSYYIPKFSTGHEGPALLKMPPRGKKQNKTTKPVSFGSSVLVQMIDSRVTHDVV